jgi:RTX calcium-binding nonapeptide repeat (4 copies)
MNCIGFHNRDLFYLSGPTFLFVGLFLLILLSIFSFFNNQFLPHAQAKSNNSGDCDRKDSNIVVGTRPITLGTECNDVIIGCPTIASATGLGSACGNGDLLRGFEKDDVIQGSIGNDEMYGDEGNDQLMGSDGTDKVYGGPGNDVLQAGAGPDLLIGANGNDELYGGPGDDVSIGGKGANYFDCGDGNDVIIDFDPDKGDTQSGNCEVVLNRHGDMNIFVQSPKIKAQLEAFGIGSPSDEIDVNDLGKDIHD